MRASQWNLCLIIKKLPTHSRHMRPTIVIHQEEPRAYCISVSSEDFIPVPVPGRVLLDHH